MTDSFIVNISNDYRYMKMGYYVSVQAELLGDEAYPKSEILLMCIDTPFFLFGQWRPVSKLCPIS